MSLTKPQRLKRSGFSKTKYTLDDLLEHVGTDISSIEFKHDQETDKVSVYSKDKQLAAGGLDAKDALEWAIIAKHEQDNPLDA